MAKVNINGVPIAYCAKGHGDAIVFLHGVGSDISVWKNQLDYFSRKWRAVAIEYPGYGESDLPEKGSDREGIARYLLSAMDGLGIEHPDPTAYSMEMWGYFEKFIWLMKPESIASIMVTLLPDMMQAMPAGMVPMMKMARSIPGGLALMGKMMPGMMPKMMPAMMPKVMPAMLAEVSRRVGPLPADMEELIPDLLPKTMDALLPNMLPLVIPDLLPKMLSYIKNEL